MKKLLLIEGLPGTGKTTATQKIYDILSAKGEHVIALFEGDERIPCDFYEMAGIPIDEFDGYEGMVMHTPNYAYVRLSTCPDAVAKQFRRWDMGDERNQQVSVAHYIPCALERLDAWVAATLDNDDTVIIDSGCLQNPINELLFRGATDDEVRVFVMGIIERIKPLNPICVYLKRESAKEAIDFAKHAKGEAWTSGVNALLDELGYPDLFAHRFDLEMSLLPLMPHVICAVQGDDWSDFDRQTERMF